MTTDPHNSASDKSLELKIALDPVVWKNYEALTDQLTGNRRDEMTRVAFVFLQALSLGAQPGASADTTKMPDPLPPAAQVMFLISYLNVTMGTPLHFSDALYDAWERSRGLNGKECSGCGYRLPASYPNCVVCGCKTGKIGIWSRGAKRASWN